MRSPPRVGVSKTVLYRYFVDKNDLTTAVMMRFTQTTLIPNLAAALASSLDGFDLAREIIRVYVDTVAFEPEPYRFVMANSSASKSKVIADSERIIARTLAVLMRRRMQHAGMDTGGVEPWAYLIVGGVQLATHSWMSYPRMSRDELIDYLTMLSWNALKGIVEVGGSLEKFRDQPHPAPIVPPPEHDNRPGSRGKGFSGAVRAASVAAEGQGHVVPAEAERVVDGVVVAAGAGCAGDHIQVDCRVEIHQVARRRDDLIAQRQDSQDRFDRAHRAD